jgi:cytochrome c553
MRKSLPSQHLPRIAAVILAATASSAVVPASPVSAADAGLGQQVYTAKCASCHGKNGEGSAKYKHKLEGDQSVAQLAETIRETMPEDKPGSLSAAEIKAVTDYVHTAFYSATARERNRPARIELARLTVKQYRNALADLVGGFRWTPKWGDVRGLKAEYFKTRRHRKEDFVAERVDPEVAFDFGVDAPLPGKMEPHEFAARWSGSLLAPETGDYEITLRTEHAARLWLNDMGRPLIDGTVKSGNDHEQKASIFLIAGRIYPLRLEYSKAKQGVDDSKTNKAKPKSVKSSVALKWQPPGRAAEIIPARCLSPAAAPEVFSIATAFPPDDRSYGWERGTTVSKAWDQATTDAAFDTADYVVRKANELAGTKDDAPDRAAKLKDFCRRFVERSFRRPLSDDLAAAYVERQFEAAKDKGPEIAVKRVVVLALKSPRFLYREVSRVGADNVAGGDTFDTAARLSFALWDSLPDQELWKAAAEGRLAKREQVAAQAERMIADPRARAKLRGFLMTWLKADHALDVAKDAKAFPGFDAAVISDLKTSLEMFLDDVVWSEGSDFRRLVNEETIYLNGRLAGFYRADVPEGGDWAKVRMPGRAGALTHPYLMTSFSHNAETSPIHRGVFIARGVLGMSLRPPPEAVAPLAPDLHPNLTTRERVTLQTKAAACMTCHGVINPLGFTLENFDAVGRYRESDHNKPVDPAGSYKARDGKTVPIRGARELARFVSGSEEAHDAFAEQMFHHLVQQPVRAYGPDTLPSLRKRFAEGGFNIRKLAVDIVASTAPVGRETKAVASATAAPGKP